jgi:phospholipid/cholesterol/gamma-HCH transport system ATP-binding protein
MMIKPTTNGTITNSWAYNKNRDRVIQVQELIARYDDRVILDKISFDVKTGEIFMIVGGSGCGKTTLLNHLIGLLQPYAGKIIVDGENVAQASQQQKLAYLRKIGVSYQSGALFGSMTLLQNICLPLKELTDLPDYLIEQIGINKLKLVGLGSFTNYMPAEASGGMQKRAAIARAMALDPKILFLDEPSSGLDPVISTEIDQLIMNLSQTLGITFVIVSHTLASIYKIGMRAILLQNGKILAEGQPLLLKNHENPEVRKFFS